MTRDIQTDKDGTRFITLEPHWCNLFENAIWQVRAVVKKEDFQSLIIEMLEFGKRMWKTECPECN